MATKWNWRKFLSFGSGAIVATLSTAYAFSPNSEDGVINSHPVKLAHKPSSHVNLQGGTIAQPQAREKMLQDAIRKSRFLCERKKDETGLPGLTVAVTVNGKLLWQEGFGYADLENNVRIKPESVMRIASISKSITMAMLAKLMEEGKIDIDKPIQTYLPTYPEKYVDGEKVTITTRHLLSHLSGIRHYVKKVNKQSESDNEATSKENKSKPSEKENKEKKTKDKLSEEERKYPEFYLKQKFDSVEESMKLFQDDELYFKPGTKFQYTSHGYTVVSAIIEKLTDTEFPKYCNRMFNFWGLKNTTLDLHEPLIHNRVRYYNRHRNGQIINAPYVDNSYKWAGGGFMSNVVDLTQFANILMYSMQTENATKKVCEKGLPKEPYLKQSTMRTIWRGNPTAVSPYGPPDILYAMGFKVGEPLRKCMFGKERDFMSVEHDGAAMGASSVLYLAFPPQTNNHTDSKSKSSGSGTKEEPEVRGVAVAMLTNITGAGLSMTAEEIAKNFKNLI